MRSRFDEQLALLNRELIEMGALCEEVIALSAQALTEGNAELAARVAQRLDLALLAVDLLIERCDARGQLRVALRQRLCRKGDDFLAQRAHRNELAIAISAALVVFSYTLCKSFGVLKNQKK